MSNILFRLIRGRPDSLPAVIPRPNEPNRLTRKSFRISNLRAAQKFQTATSIARAAKARGGSPPGHAMACSLRDSLQGSRGSNRPHPTLRTSFPTSLHISVSGQAQRATGSSIASMQLSKNSTGYLCLQPAFHLAFTTSLQLFENSNQLALTQAQHLWESPRICGKPVAAHGSGVSRPTHTFHCHT
jgi:hypothetical protein